MFPRDPAFPEGVLKTAGPQRSGYPCRPSGLTVLLILNRNAGKTVHEDGEGFFPKWRLAFQTDPLPKAGGRSRSRTSPALVSGFMSRAVLILIAMALLLLFLVFACLFPRRIGPAGRMNSPPLFGGRERVAQGVAGSAQPWVRMAASGNSSTQPVFSRNR